MAASRRRVRAKPEDRRQQVVAEAIRLIGERGYNGFTIHELAQRCALSNPGLLHYFGSKEALLVAVLADRDRQDAEAVTSVAGLKRRGTEVAQPTLRQAIELFRATVARNSAQPELVRLYAVLQAEALSAAHPAHAYFKARQASAITAFAQAIAPYVADADSAALQLMAMMNGLEQEWLRTAQAFDLVAEWDRAVARLLPAA